MVYNEYFETIITTVQFVTENCESYYVDRGTYAISDFTIDASGQTNLGILKYDDTYEFTIDSSSETSLGTLEFDLGGSYD